MSFVAEVTTTTVRPGGTLDATFTLTNTGAKTVAWVDLRMGWNVFRVDEKTGKSRLISFEPYNFIGVGRGSPSRRSVLRAGQSASRHSALVNLPAGSYWLAAVFDGTSGPSGKTQDIFVRSVAR